MCNKYNNLKSQLAFLETKVDMLETELSRLNEMLIAYGFPEGIHTLKEAIKEILAESYLQ